MREIFKRVLYVSLSLRGPDSLPGSRGMLSLCLVPWAAVTIASNLIKVPGHTAPALAGVAFELMLLFSYSWLALRISDKLERWPQTLVSLIGVQAVIVALELPLAYLAARQDEPLLLFQLAEFAFLAWWLVALANIMSRALDRSLTFGVLLSAGYFMLWLIGYAMLFQALGVIPEAS